MVPLHLAIVVKCHRTHRHISTLLDVGPRRVNDCQIRLFVPFDRIRLDELRAFADERFRYRLPAVDVVGESKVYVSGGEFVDVKPDVSFEAVLEQLFIFELVLAHVDRRWRIHCGG